MEAGDAGTGFLSARAAGLPPRACALAGGEGRIVPANKKERSEFRVRGSDAGGASSDVATFGGAVPYDDYTFILHLAPGAYGGLEHKNSTVLMGSRWATRTRRAYLNWLDLASHEFFHAWNVKRLRPVELGPFDYENEVHTKSLWIAEGITDYYADLALHRAGLMSREEFLDSLSDKVEELQTTPGRLVQSAELASFDAWIKYYRPDENSVNTAISYYTKGAVVALLLDALVGVVERRLMKWQPRQGETEKL